MSARAECLTQNSSGGRLVVATGLPAAKLAITPNQASSLVNYSTDRPSPLVEVEIVMDLTDHPVACRAVDFCYRRSSVSGCVPGDFDSDFL